MKADSRTEAAIMSVVRQGLEAFARRDVEGLMAFDEVDSLGAERIHNVEKLSKTRYNRIRGILPVVESRRNVSSLHPTKILTGF